MKELLKALEKESRFDKEEQILYRKMQGFARLEDVLGSLDSISNDNLLPRELRMIDDSTALKIRISVSELELISERIEIVASRYRMIKHAVIHSDPQNTALSMLLANMIKPKKYYFRVFSTREAAKNWIKN